MEKQKIIIDVWDGNEGNIHVARFFRPLSAALKLANREVRAGYLVNLAQTEDVAFGADDDFDCRHLQ